MKINEEGYLLRIFIGEADYKGSKPLYQALVEKARSMNIAGATVLKGFMGYGAKSLIHTVKVLRLSEDLPIIIEIVDTKEKIDSFLKEIDGWIKEGLITLERVQVILYRS